MASPHLAEQVGRVLDGRYRVVAPIGTGASAAVFLADDVVLRRRVAIKVLHAALAGDQGFIKRFQAEAHTAAGLSHPNIMRVLDWGEAENGPFLVLEYLGGGSLRSVLDHIGTLSPEQAARIGLQAARALDYAHRRGLVHRDVKPANLLFDEEARLAIADFGLARALAEAAWTEPGGAVLGTARYASPEQVRGQSLTGKADVYALGLVLIEAVCGFVPFTADTTLATLMGRLDAKVVAPPEMGPLGPIVEKACMAEPDERIDAAELVRLLDSAASELPDPEPLRLPGAVVIDVTSPVGVDPTMLPSKTPDAEVVVAESPAIEPLPPVKRRWFRRRPKAEVAAVPGDAAPSADGLGALAGSSAPSASSAPSSSGPGLAGIHDPSDVNAPGAVSAFAGGDVSRSKRRRPSRSSVLLALSTVLLLAAVSGVGYAWYFYTGRETPVPPLEGLTLDVAQATAAQAEVKFSFAGEEFSETVPSGTTFDQTPEPGDTVRPRESVRVKVSKGPAPRAVPAVTGQMIDEARRSLADKGFVVVTTNRFSETEPTGKVLEANPSTGDHPKGTEVRLILSGGPAPRTVPDLVGSSYEDAVAALRDLQLNATRTETFSDTVPAGQVASTNPRPGGSLARGGTVAVAVSKGPDLVAIPDLRGRTVVASTAALQAVGLEAGSVYGPAAGTVFDAAPAIGTRVKRGSSVNLYTK